MGSESLPEWALLALEKRARLLESALTDENTKRFLELETGQEETVLHELQDATNKAANSEFTKTEQPVTSIIRSNPSVQPSRPKSPIKEPQKQSIPSPIAIPQKIEPTVRKQTTVTPSFQFPPQQQHQIQYAIPRQAQPPPPTPTQMMPTAAPQPPQFGQFSLLNPFIVQPGMFNTPEQYERFLRLQEEQIRIAREQIELQKSLNFSNYSNLPSMVPITPGPFTPPTPVSPYQQTGLLMPFQQAPPPSPIKLNSSNMPQVQHQPPPPPSKESVSITEAVQKINYQSSSSTIQSQTPKPIQKPAQPPNLSNQSVEKEKKIVTQSSPVVVNQYIPENREMIEHEAINKRGALAMFKALESGNQVTRAPVYQSQPTKSYLKPSPTKISEKPKSILKKSEPVQSTPPPPVVNQKSTPVVNKTKPDIVRESENQRGDLDDDCKNVSVANIKSKWGAQVNTPPSPPTEHETNNNDDFDLFGNQEPILTSLKPLPEDYIDEKTTKQESHNIVYSSDSEESLNVDDSYIVNHHPVNQENDLLSLQSVASTTLNDPEDIKRLVLKHLPDVAPKPNSTVITPEESEQILDQHLNERRKTIEEVRTIQSDLDEMTRKANAAISIMNDSKTFQVKPQKKEKTDKTVEKSKQPDIIEQATENERAYAEENARLEEEIRAAQAVLASMKPNVKPKGNQRTPQKPDRQVVPTPPAAPDEKPKPKKRAPQPKGSNTISIEPDINKSQYARVGSNFIADREGYVNDVVVEGAGIIRNGGIVKTKPRVSNSSVQFYPEATELSYPCEIDAVHEWDAEHGLNIGGGTVLQLDQVETTEQIIKNQVTPSDRAILPTARPRKRAPPPPPPLPPSPPIVVAPRTNQIISNDFTLPPGYRVSNLRKTFITPF